KAFLKTDAVLAELQTKYGAEPMQFICVTEQEVTTQECVQTYLFNSQLLSLPDGTQALIAPIECAENQAVKARVDAMCADSANTVNSAHFLDVRESMRNGGGPACLRLRVAVNEAELNALHQRILLTDSLHATLVGWVERHYRDRLTIDDLADPKLAEETYAALDELTAILDLGSVYPFQLG
ncbi:MAG: N-succinylarginine dihydrolase, partial [Alphaproteobacteria bacterium]|nr:N-succinylarginine dihydrolase [Alphaproteobacteria bacterium]